MNDRISRRVAALLAHPAGFAYFNLFTLAWFALPFVIGLVAGALFGVEVGIGALVLSRWLLPGYLDVVTWFSSATQFTLSYQNDEAGRKLDASLDELFVTNATLLRLAHDEAADRKRELALQEAVAAQSDAVAEIVRQLQADLNTRRRRAGGKRA